MRRPARLPPTEQRHPRSKGLESLPLGRALEILHQGDLEATQAVGRALPSLTRLASRIARVLSSGGRLVYVGAGTSGRLGALDAAECPPTFGVEPSQVVALVAGGQDALARAAEGAEDDSIAARAAIRGARIAAKDLVVGLSASGTTPFVLTALSEARRKGAAAVLVTSNPSARPPGTSRIVIDTGPELVAGSTRMKAGAAFKMALALVTTGAMLRLGKVREGHMIDLRPTNEKLRRRAIRMVMELGALDERSARTALVENGWRVRDAIDRSSLPGASRTRVRP